MYAKFPCYNASLESEDRVLNTDLIEEVLPHADVTMTHLGAVPCCEVRFQSCATTIVLLSFTDMSTRLGALVGIVDQTGSIT